MFSFIIFEANFVLIVDAVPSQSISLFDVLSKIDRVSTKVDLLEMKLDGILEAMKELSAAMLKKPNMTTIRPNDSIRLPRLPLQHMSEVMEVDEQLRDEEFRNQMVSDLFIHIRDIFIINEFNSFVFHRSSF